MYSFVVNKRWQKGNLQNYNWWFMKNKWWFISLSFWRQQIWWRKLCFQQYTHKTYSNIKYILVQVSDSNSTAHTVTQWQVNNPNILIISSTTNLQKTVWVPRVPQVSFCVFSQDNIRTVMRLTSSDFLKNSYTMIFQTSSVLPCFFRLSLLLSIPYVFMRLLMIVVACYLY